MFFPVKSFLGDCYCFSYFLCSFAILCQHTSQIFTCSSFCQSFHWLLYPILITFVFLISIFTSYSTISSSDLLIIFWMSCVSSKITYFIQILYSLFFLPLILIFSSTSKGFPYIFLSYSSSKVKHMVCVFLTFIAAFWFWYSSWIIHLSFQTTPSFCTPINLSLTQFTQSNAFSICMKHTLTHFPLKLINLIFSSFYKPFTSNY